MTFDTDGSLGRIATSTHIIITLVRKFNKLDGIVNQKACSEVFVIRSDLLKF